MLLNGVKVVGTTLWDKFKTSSWRVNSLPARFLQHKKKVKLLDVEDM
jgi:hypothetical protein